MTKVREKSTNRVFTGLEFLVLAGAVIAAIVHTPLGEWGILAIITGAIWGVAAVITGYLFIAGVTESGSRTLVFAKPESYRRIASLAFIAVVGVLSFVIVGNIMTKDWTTVDILMVGLWGYLSILLLSFHHLAGLQIKGHAADQRSGR